MAIHVTHPQFVKQDETNAFEEQTTVNNPPFLKAATVETFLVATKYL